MRKSTLSLGGALVGSLVFSSVSIAADAPACMGPDGPIPINNGQVLDWKTTTPNTYLDRAHVRGTVGDVYPDKNGHHHFQLVMGPSSSETVEIIFNEDFGTTPDIENGMSVEACGDFINEFQPANGYPASPDGAIVHWVHQSNSPKHASGYLIIDGTLYGGSPNGRD
jgi:hypothetical protein